MEGERPRRAAKGARPRECRRWDGLLSKDPGKSLCVLHLLLVFVQMLLKTREPKPERWVISPRMLSLLIQGVGCTGTRAGG